MNLNGEGLIEFCLENEIKIGITHFMPNSVHKITREMRTRNERSITDYLLLRKPLWPKDTIVKKGAEIGSDHYLVKEKTEQDSKEESKMLQTKQQYQDILSQRAGNIEKNKDIKET
ncbi:hypothetical protein ILUMI_25617 [Ignelater luminosus]|uniref:Uncharacterized protein n=1 Tax=Ignelater luminosus TaxID=2038154 RepID=A0A8K0C858_IGNLU|nr:hypothetical protein ILUMI_25617 [Ignelater luminosus]